MIVDEDTGAHCTIISIWVGLKSPITEVLKETKEKRERQTKKQILNYREQIDGFLNST